MNSLSLIQYVLRCALSCVAGFVVIGGIACAAKVVVTHPHGDMLPMRSIEDAMKFLNSRPGHRANRRPSDTEAAIEAVEAKYGIRIPHDLRMVYLETCGIVANGAPGGFFEFAVFDFATALRCSTTGGDRALVVRKKWLIGACAEHPLYACDVNLDSATTVFAVDGDDVFWLGLAEVAAGSVTDLIYEKLMP